MRVDASSSSGSILVLGADELGMAVLRALAKRTPARGNISVNALLRPSAIQSRGAGESENVAELRSLGINLVPGELAAASVADLAGPFAHLQTLVAALASWPSGERISSSHRQP
jgi:hypothetical protein